MLLAILQITGGVLLLFAGAESLVRGSTALAFRVGLSPLVIGLTVVAFGTSSPELTVSVQAALIGNGTLSLTNVIGSNICNIALILGVSALLRPLKIQLKLLRFDIPVLIVSTLALTVLLLDDTLSRIEGLLFTLSIVAYTSWLIYSSKKEKVAVQEEFADLVKPTYPLWLQLLFIGGGLGILFLGTNLLLEGAVSLATMLEVSQAIIGLTIVAVGTSLPELATSIVASLRNEADIVIGNVIGSNIFNILGILGVAALTRPLFSQEIKDTDLLFMTLLALLMVPLLRSGFRLVRLEGAFLLFLYVGYVIFLLQ